MRRWIELLAIPLIFGAVWLGLRWYRQPTAKHGNPAPLFAGALPNGDSLRLEDFRGKIVLLDFWGSWCGPCRQANPELVALHQQYQGKTFKQAKGFEIISVGIETKREAWLNAIQKDGLVWPHHVSDLKRFNDHVALLYGVREIPTTFLLDENLRIVGVNLSKHQIEDVLKRK